MLLGRVAAPLAPPGAGDRQLLLHEGRQPLKLTDVDSADVAAALAAAGHTTAWARLAPHDLDPTAFATLAGAMSASAPPETPSAGSGTPVVVVESGDDRQVDAFLDQVRTTWAHPRRPIPVILCSTVPHPTDLADPSSPDLPTRGVGDLIGRLHRRIRT